MSRLIGRAGMWKNEDCVRFPKAGLIPAKNFVSRPNFGRKNLGETHGFLGSASLSRAVPRPSGWPDSVIMVSLMSIRDKTSWASAIETAFVFFDSGNEALLL